METFLRVFPLLKSCINANGGNNQCRIQSLILVIFLGQFQVQNASTFIVQMDVHVSKTRPAVNWLMDILAAVLHPRVFAVPITSTAALMDSGKLRS